MGSSSGANKIVLACEVTSKVEVKDTRKSVLAKFTVEFAEDETVVVQAWGELAERAEKIVRKGVTLVIHGRLAQSRWTSGKGKKRSRHYISASKIIKV